MVVNIGIRVNLWMCVNTDVFEGMRKGICLQEADGGLLLQPGAEAPWMVPSGLAKSLNESCCCTVQHIKYASLIKRSSLLDSMLFWTKFTITA